MVEAIIKGVAGLNYSSGFMSTYNRTLKTDETLPTELQECNYRSMFNLWPGSFMALLRLIIYVS